MSPWSTATTRVTSIGLITQFDLLEARQKLLEEERRAERVLLVRRVPDGEIDDRPPGTLA